MTRAHDELESLGFIEMQRTRGTFVCTRLPYTRLTDQRARLRDAARRILNQAYLAGIGFDEVVSILKEPDDYLTRSRREAS